MAEEKQQSSYKKLFSNTLVFAIGSFSSKVLVLLLIPIYTSYLSTSELGITDVLTQIANWIIPLVTLTVTEAIIRFGLDKACDKKQVFTIGNIICAFGLGIFAIILPLVSLTGLVDKYIGGYSILLYAYVFMSSLKSLYQTFVRAMENVKLFAFNGILTTFLTLFFTAMFYIVLPENFLGEGTGIEKYLLATILSDFISTIFLTLKEKLWKYIDIKHLDREMMQTMLQYSVPLIPAQLLWLITNSSDSFMTTHYMGSGANGILSAAYKIPNIVATVYMMFGQAWNMSAITEHNSKDRNKFYENVFDFNQSLLYILAAGCMLIIQPVTNIMIGENFRECVNYSPILIYSTIFSCFTTFMGSIYLATKKTKRSLFTSLVSGIINVGLNVILIPRIGLYGPPISTVASYVTVFIIRAYDSRKLVPFKINIKKLVLSNIILLGMLAILLADTNLMGNIPIYFVLFALFCGVFIINKNAISSIFYKMLPKKIADRISNINEKKLALALLGAIVFLAINFFTLWIPLIVLAFAGCILAFIKDKKALYWVCALIFSVALSKSFFLAPLLAMCLLPLFKYKNIKSIVITIFVLDLFVAINLNHLLGIFIILLEILLVLFITRKTIWHKLNKMANKK